MRWQKSAFGWASLINSRQVPAIQPPAIFFFDFWPRTLGQSDIWNKYTYKECESIDNREFSPRSI